MLKLDVGAEGPKHLEVEEVPQRLPGIVVKFFRVLH